MKYPIAFGLMISGFFHPALAQEVEGNWQGVCIADGKPSANLGIHLHHGANNLTTKRISDGMVVSIPINGVHVTFGNRALRFQYTSPNTGDLRTFDGQANNDFTAIIGTLTQAGKTPANCTLNFSPS